MILIQNHESFNNKKYQEINSYVKCNVEYRAAFKQVC